MKLNEYFVFRRVFGDNYLIPVGENASVAGTINLNDSAAFIVECLKEDTNEVEIAEKLAHNYGISLEQAVKDVSALLNSLRQLDALG